MLDVKKVPFTKNVLLYERTIGALNVSPAWVANLFGLSCDEGHDDLDVFKIIIIELRGQSLGFLRHMGSPDDFSGVCNISNLPGVELRTLVVELFSGHEVEFTEYDEPW